MCFMMHTLEQLVEEKLLHKHIHFFLWGGDKNIGLFSQEISTLFLEL